MTHEIFVVEVVIDKGTKGVNAMVFLSWRLGDLLRSSENVHIRFIGLPANTSDRLLPWRLGAIVA